MGSSRTGSAGVGGWLAGVLLVNWAVTAAAGPLLERVEFRPLQGRERELLSVPQAGQPPRVDGVLDDPAWKGAYRTDRFTWGGGRRATNATQLLIAHDPQTLYLAARCTVADSAKLKTKWESGKETGEAWSDDCVDFKLSADGGRTTFQFLLAAGGAYYDTRNGDEKQNPAWTRAAKIGQGEYSLEMAIPLAALGVATLKPGLPLLFNFGRADRTAGELTVLAEPYLELDTAPFLVLGSAAEHRAYLTSGLFLREATLQLLLDRDQYPVFASQATGRITVRSGPTGTGLTGKPAMLVTLLRDGKPLRTERLAPLATPVLDFDLPLTDLKPGAYALEVRLADGDDVLPPVQRREFVVYAAKAPRSGRIPVTVPPAPVDLAAWPVTFGVPFPWGALDSPDNVQLLDAAGHEVPIQTRVSGRWSRTGSVRWLLVDCILPAATTPQALTLVYGPNVRRAPVTAPLTVDDTGDKVTVTTGPLRFAVPKHDTPGLAQLWLDRNGDGTFDPGEARLRADKTGGPYLVDEKGTVYRGSADRDAVVTVESAGPLKACVSVSGWHVAESGAKLGKFVLRYYAYAGLPYVRVYHTFVITASSNQATVGTPPGSPGTEEVRYRDIAYALPVTNLYYFMGTPKIDFGWVREKDSSAWLLQRDDVTCRLFANGAFTDECEKAEGWMSVGTTGAMLTVAVKDFWQQFPKEFEVRPDRAIVHFWPAHTEPPVRTGKNLSLQTVYPLWFAHEGLLDFKIPEEVLAWEKKESVECYPGAVLANAVGLAKTHEFLLYPHAADWETARARTVSRAFQANATATCAPEWVCASGVFGHLAPRRAGKFAAIESTFDETIACLFRQSEMDRDYGMLNFGDAHHNWDWQGRRWNLHRIWRNTHHGWTRWPWLMYVRTGRKDLFDWGDRNARHVADVDHCHYAPPEFVGLPWPRGKCVGGICDYKGFVHWSSGNRLCYNSVADAMLDHYYLTGDERSRTTALEHGAALLADGKAQEHREGAGRVTSAIALYYLTWDNAYLDFIERTIDRLLGTQADDGSFPQWEDFAPFLQRYVDLTGSRRAMASMARWADSTCAVPDLQEGYTAKISVLTHAYLYTGNERYLRVAAYRLNASIENQYLGEDPRYRGMFMVGNSNLDQSYLLQWMGYYLAGLDKYGKTPEPLGPERTWIRTHDRVTLEAAERQAWTAQYGAEPATPHLWQARLCQRREAAFDLEIQLSGYNAQSYMAELRPAGGAPPIRAFAAASKNGGRAALRLSVPTDSALEYELRIVGANNFSVRVPITCGQPELKEVYPLFGQGTMVGDGVHCYFSLPDATTAFTLGYKGRAWPLRIRIFAPNGEVVAEDSWVGSDDPLIAIRHLSAQVGNRSRTGWAVSISGYGQGGLHEFTASPKLEPSPFFFALDRDKLFSPVP